MVLRRVAMLAAWWVGTLVVLKALLTVGKKVSCWAEKTDEMKVVMLAVQKGFSKVVQMVATRVAD